MSIDTEGKSCSDSRSSACWQRPCRAVEKVVNEVRRVKYEANVPRGQGRHTCPCGNEQ